MMQPFSPAGAVSGRVWHAIGDQLRSPHGLVGWLAGVLMRLVNDGPNRRAVDALEIGATDQVLELGCGPGHGLALMAAAATRGVVYGLDRSLVMLEQASWRNGRAIAAGRVNIGTGSFERLAFLSDSLDGVLAVNVAYFWADAGRVTREIHRVLRPGGRLAIYVTAASTMRRWPFASPATHRLIDAEDLQRMLLEGGFEPDQMSVRAVGFAGGVAGLLAVATRS